MSDLFAAAARCISEPDPAEKIRLTRLHAECWKRGELSMDHRAEVEEIGPPGRPTLPELVPPNEVPFRGMGTPEARAALIHALAHIEFNAVNLAWDAVYRFRNLPDEYYSDWVGVAVDEALHYELLRERLVHYGFEYGDFVAHNGLWEMATKTADSLVARMALVPRVLEARSLDVTPGIITRFRSAADPDSAAVIEIIQRDELGHVEAGSRWYRYACAAVGLDPVREFRHLVALYMNGRVKPPFNEQARREAGFNDEEIEGLREMLAGG
ncbi:MAG: ferritin-like domain-containing protein [Gammaproteobacteria bacterium]